MTTMVQAGLFENMVLISESQSRQAKYHRAYRSNPENRDRINSQKKRRRLLKKEKEFGRTICIFESEASPITSQPQTVENTSAMKVSDRASVPESSTTSSQELTDSSRSHCLKEKMSAFSYPQNHVCNEQASNQGGVDQAEIILDLRREIAELRRRLETAPPGMQTIGLEKQNISDCKITDRETIQKTPMPSKNFFTSFASAIIFTALTALASWFVAQQTGPLYKSLNIPIPELSSYGALALAISLSAFASIKGSRLAKVFLAVMFCYEFLLVVAGTKVNQKDLMQEALNANPSYSLAQEALDTTRKDYEQKKARYESKSSKVYQNAWYKRKILGPAYEKYAAATKELSTMKVNLSDRGLTGYLCLILKVFLRISAIVVAVMFAESAIMLVTRPFVISVQT